MENVALTKTYEIGHNFQTIPKRKNIYHTH